MSRKNPYMMLKKYEGATVKYRNLCEIIGENPLEGSSKIAHLKRISQYVDMEKREKGRLYIHKVYDAEDELAIIYSSGKYTKYIEFFLLNAFKEIGRQEGLPYVVLTNRDILEATCMVNKEYFSGKSAPYKYLSKFTLPIKRADVPNEKYKYREILDKSDIFFSSSYRLLKRVIKDSLDILEKKSLILINKTFRLYRNEWVDGIFRSSYYDCGDKEIERILTTQRKSVIEFNDQVPTDINGNKFYFLKEPQSAHFLYPEQKKEYYAILNKNLKKEFRKEGWNAYSTAWKLNLAKGECFEQELEALDYKEFNKKIQRKLLTAKDLDIIENALKKQFVSTFIKC